MQLVVCVVWLWRFTTEMFNFTFDVVMSVLVGCYLFVNDSIVLFFFLLACCFISLNKINTTAATRVSHAPAPLHLTQPACR